MRISDWSSDVCSSDLCRSVAKRNNPADGAGIVETSGNEPTYTLGLEWQATDKILLYFSHRHGFRGVTVNSPKFEPPFTTGGNDVLYAAVLDRFGCFDIVVSEERPVRHGV